MAAPNFRLESQDKVTTIFIDRPEQRNALSTQMWLAIPEIIQEEALAGTSVIIFAGAGGNFGAGADFADLKDLKTTADADYLWRAIAGALEACYYAPLTAIARIHGACLGGSCLLASACDLRYAAADASLGIPVAKLGIVLDDGCVNRLADLVGTARARELLFSGCTISGIEAQSIGLVNKAMEEAELTAYTLTQAKTIAANSSNTIKEVKQSLSRRRRSPDSDVLIKQMERIRNSYLSNEFKERLSKL